MVERFLVVTFTMGSFYHCFENDLLMTSILPSIQNPMGGPLYGGRTYLHLSTANAISC